MAPKKDVLQQKSPAEFFAENRTIAGFDNVRLPPRKLMFALRPSSHLPATHPPSQCSLWHSFSSSSAFFFLPPPPLQPGKCLYTTMRELVENALDSAESISVLPDIDITM